MTQLTPTGLLVLVLAAPSVHASPQDDDTLDQEELEAITEEIRLEIEGIRDQEFRRPVEVAVADEKTLLEYMRARMAKETTPEELAADQTVAKLLGQIPAEMDLLAEFEALIESQVGGFYDPDEEAFYVMERFGGDMARIILAHELTHALDDQLYDLDGVLDELSENGDAGFAFLAVVEGSGLAVMNAWIMRHLAELDLQDLLEAGSMGAEAMEDAPPLLWKPLIAPYVRGVAFLNRTSNVLMGSQAMPKLDDFEAAFAAPPLSSEQILHPEKYWNPDQRDDPVRVSFKLESIAGGWEVLREDTLGELGWGLVVEPPEKRVGLKGQLAPLLAKYTFDASEGWGGDRFVLLGRGDARVLHCETTWDTEADAEEFRAALEVLRAHLEASAAATAAHLGLEGSGVLLLAGAAGQDVALRVWMGVSAAVAGSALAGIEARIASRVPDHREPR